MFKALRLQIFLAILMALGLTTFSCLPPAPKPHVPHPIKKLRENRHERRHPEPTPIVIVQPAPAPPWYYRPWYRPSPAPIPPHHPHSPKHPPHDPTPPKHPDNSSPHHGK
jgi:hypothetical protein